MAALLTSAFEIPKQILDPWVGKIQGGSTVAQLSPSIPMVYGPGEWTAWESGEAEYVGEGAQKSSNDLTKKTGKITHHKFQKTVRFSDEVTWADEAHRLRIVQTILDQIQPALSRALDYGIYHGINPKTGAAVAAITDKLVDTTNSVTVDPAQETFLATDAAKALVLADEYMPTGFALDTSLAARLVTQRYADATKQLVYPGFIPQVAAGTVDGLNASVSKTVSARGVAAAPTNVVGFVGDFSAIRWGIQKSIGISKIEYGDPDGLGDLQRLNQVAFRAEIVYGWGIADKDAFAKLVTA